MNNPIVSVVMSVYIPDSSNSYDDNIRYLHQAVESILQQTYTDFNILLSMTVLQIMWQIF